MMYITNNSYHLADIAKNENMAEGSITRRVLLFYLNPPLVKTCIPWTPLLKIKEKARNVC